MLIAQEIATFKGLSVLNCPFNMGNKLQGQLMFLTDSNGYVYELCIACQKSNSFIFADAAIMWCIDVFSIEFTESETIDLGKILSLMLIIFGIIF